MGNSEKVAIDIDERARNENAPRGSGAVRMLEGCWKAIFSIYEILSDLCMRIIIPSLYHVGYLLPKAIDNTFFTRNV